MNTAPRLNLSILIVLGLIAISTLILAASLSSLRIGPGSTAYSAPALFNQGNADAQRGKTGQAIANYERARLLAPANADIAANLQWVREQAGLSAASSSWLERITSFASPNTMALLGWLGLVLAGTGIISARSITQFRSGLHLTAFVGILLIGISALGAVSTWQKYNEAVVITSDASAMISPVTNGEAAFKLRAGEMVTIAGQYNDFALVKNSTGHSGWVAQGDITPLIPRS